LPVVLFLLLAALPDMSFASDEDREAWHSPARLSGIHGDKQFLAGSEVYVQAEVGDDVFAAGGEVRVRDTKAADLFLAGGFVNLRGVVLLIAVPIAAVIAMATAIGLPLGLFALLLYAVALAAGLIAAALWIGQYLPKLRGRHAQHTEYRWCLARVAAGLVVLGLVVLVPFLGGLALAIAGVLGLGGVAMQGWTLIGTGAGQTSA
jgi:hypothetical protein